VARRAELDAQIGAWCAQHTLSDVLKAADDAGIGNARYNTTTDVVAHPHLADRGRWREVDSPVGPLTTLLPPPIIAGHETPTGAIPGLGQHTDAVLHELGLDQKGINTLRESGAIGPAYQSISKEST
jgi:crotonobetainyl-CoA:carnitine CoA-transferase CaiB-like acyl-CoA transferase